MASVPSDDVNAEVDKAAALLSWLAKVTNDPGIESRVALGTTRYGRGLVALRNLVPGEVIFNVPWRLVLAEDHDEADASDLPWSALMAARLLEERHANGERAQPGKPCCYTSRLGNFHAPAPEFRTSMPPLPRDKGAPQG